MKRVAVDAELGLLIRGEEERQRQIAVGEFGESDRVLGLGDVDVEVVDAELIEVAEDDVARPAGDQARPVVEGLLEMVGEVGAAFLHLDEDLGLPDEIGEGGAALGVLDPELEDSAGLLHALLAEGL